MRRERGRGEKEEAIEMGWARWGGREAPRGPVSLSRAGTSGASGIEVYDMRPFAYI